MHHFQLKPVRSLDSLRSAWSGHLRHGPPPSTVIANPREVPSAKPISSSSRPPLPPDNSVDRSNVISNTLDATVISETAKAFNSLTTMKPNRAVKDVTSLLPVPSVYDQTADSNLLSHESHIHNNLMETVDSSSRIREKKNPKTEGEFSSRDETLNSKDILANTDSIPNTWDSEPYDKPFVTSSFLHEASENDPFDTNRVFMPPYLRTPLFKSTIPSMPVQFHHPLPHPFNATSCSAHAKVNIIVHYFFFYL